MIKPVAVLVTSVLAAGVLAGCGGDDPYCAAVKENRTALDSFGAKPSDTAFARYQKAVRSVTATAPDTTKPDWAAIGAAMERVTKAQKAAGIKLEEMTDSAKTAQLSSADLSTLNTAYEAFNKTAKQRTAVVKDVKDTCSITLK